MAYAGQTIDNPITGEHITFIETNADTNGRYLLFDCRAEAGKPGLPPHVHATQSEHFEVISGTLGVMLDGKTYTLNAGDRIMLPAGIKHRWWNAGEDDVLFRVKAVPARNLEAVLEANAGMAEAGKLNKKGMPKNPFLLAHLGKVSETYLPGVPVGLQKFGLAMGSGMARLLGYSADFAEYRTMPAMRPVEQSAA